MLPRFTSHVRVCVCVCVCCVCMREQVSEWASVCVCVWTSYVSSKAQQKSPLLYIDNNIFQHCGNSHSVCSMEKIAGKTSLVDICLLRNCTQVKVNPFWSAHVYLKACLCYVLANMYLSLQYTDTLYKHFRSLSMSNSYIILGGEYAASGLSVTETVINPVWALYRCIFTFIIVHSIG